MNIIYFCVVLPDDDFNFFKLSILQFSKVNDYDFKFYIYSYYKIDFLEHDPRFIIKDLKDLKSSKYKLSCNRYLMIFKFFELSKIHKNSYICYVSYSLFCLKSLKPVFDTLKISDKTSEKIQNGIVLAGVRDYQGEQCSEYYRLYARKYLSIRAETYLSSSIIFTKGFHIYREEFKQFLETCPDDLLNPEMDFINWYFKNKIQYLDDSVCINYTNNNLKDFYSYDYNTDFKPTAILCDYVKYIDASIIIKIFDDFKYVYNIINELNKECNLLGIIEKINDTKIIIGKCMEDLKDKDLFTRRHILRSSD